MKSRLLIVVTVLVLSAITPSSAQQIHRCGFDHWMGMQAIHRSEYYDAMNHVIRAWKEQDPDRGGGGVLVLPVVFHVVYNTDAQNIPDSVILSQIEVLNEDYRRLNEDAANTRDIFLPFAADCEIEFQLANTDPWGNPTTGITHTYTERTGFELDLFAAENTLDEVKSSATGGVDAWDTEHYINVWVCNIEEGFLGQIFGLAYPPAGLDNWPAGSAAPDPALEGVIIHYTTAGRNNPVAGEDDFEGNDKGRTLTHEMGHYLGLRHTWGDAIPFFEDGCEVDDGIEDTPNTATGDQFQCNYESNSCETDLPDDLPDQIENYMDYTPDDCLNMFTQQQRELMRYVVLELRPGLLEGVGIAETSTPNDYSVFPNPATESVRIEFGRYTRTHMRLTDMTGRVVKEIPVTGFQVLTDISDLQSGTYILTDLSANGRFQKIIIQ